MQVSVVIPVYNAAPFVANAVCSALAQPETGQVILVEDGSTDDSLAVCASMVKQHDGVALLTHPGGQNRGVSASRNLGIAAAPCEYVAFLDADDWYLPGRFKAAAEIFAADPSVDGVYDAIGTVCEDGQVGDWYRGKQDPDLLTLSEPVHPDDLFEALVAGDRGFFCTDGIVVRKSLFERTGGFDTSLRMGEDTAMWVRMSVLGRLSAGSIREPVGMRRLHARNTIYKGRDHNARYAVQMAESLLNWGRRIGLPRRRLVLLNDWLFNFSMGDIYTDSSYLAKKAAELAFYADFAVEHPLALRSRHFWSVVGASVGLKRLNHALAGCGLKPVRA